MPTEQTLCTWTTARIASGTILEPMQPLRRITRETAEWVVREMERSGRTAREVLENRWDRDLEGFESQVPT